MEPDVRSRREVVRNAGPYYHVTPAENVEAILIEGLDPEKWDRDLYTVVGMGDRPFVCLSPARNRLKFVNAIASNTESGRVALLEIDASVVSELDCELDSSNTELEVLKAALGSVDFSTLLAAGADLICFEVIPPTAIRVALPSS